MNIFGNYLRQLYKTILVKLFITIIYNSTFYLTTTQLNRIQPKIKVMGFDLKVINLVLPFYQHHHLYFWSILTHFMFG